jgi:hypothetical protein
MGVVGSIGGFIHTSEHAIVPIGTTASTTATSFTSNGRSNRNIRRSKARKHAFNNGLDLLLIESHREIKK